MSALMEILGESLGGGAMDQIGQQLGVDRQTAQGAVGVALPILVGALSRNASSPGGAGALAGVLQNHDGGLLDNLESYLGQSSGGIGGSILGHVLGGRQDSMAQSVGRASGLDAGSAAQLLTLLAPIVLAALSRAHGQAGGASSVTDILGGAQSHMQQSAPQGMDLVSQMLDSNHDGSIADDVTRMGVGLLGSLFSRR